MGLLNTFVTFSIRHVRQSGVIRRDRGTERIEKRAELGVSHADRLVFFALWQDTSYMTEENVAVSTSLYE